MNPTMAKVVKARMNLLFDQPFFGTLLLRLELVEDPTCETFWTDGARLGFNPEFCETLTTAEIQGVLCHEVLHCAMAHIFRQGDREHEQWNVACDYAINPIVVGAGMRLPKGALLEAQYVGRSAEWIYSNLPKQPQGGSQQQGDTPGAGCGEVRQAKAQESGPDTKEQEARWEVAVQNAAAMAAGQGKLPAGVGIIVEELRRPRVDWRAELRRFVQQYAADDYSWVMPNRRYIASGFYLPTLRSESMPPIAIFGDSSGSTRRMLPMFISEMQSIINEVQPEKTYFGWCDAQVYEPDVFERGEPIDTTPKGGGGTDFRPVFEWIEQQGVTPACLIFFTDLEGPFPQTPPDYPVLWITPTRNIAPFGETVEVQL